MSCRVPLCFRRTESWDIHLFHLILQVVALLWVVVSDTCTPEWPKFGSIVPFQTPVVMTQGGECVLLNSEFCIPLFWVFDCGLNKKSANCGNKTNKQSRNVSVFLFGVVKWQQISGVWERKDPHTTPAQGLDRISQERYLDCFCPQCWIFQNFSHNKDEVRDWSFLVAALRECKVKDPKVLQKGLKDPIKDSEMQKILPIITSKIIKHWDLTHFRLSSLKQCHQSN